MSAPFPIATPSQTIGPFFSFGLTTDHRLGIVATANAPGEHIRLTIRVWDGDDVAVSDAMIELSQADHAGLFATAPHFRGFGRLGTAADGAATFDTVRPGSQSDRSAPREAAHVNLCVFVRGLLRQVYTRAYFLGDPLLAEDPVLALVPSERRQTLMAKPMAHDDSAWAFDIHLQGKHETVFFDV